MKPIKLKIKGLNSFIEQQVVDFEKLTSQGFFGIFGPTGSGKSTILDGITLALYGKLARNSTNYINTNCDTLDISYEFKISKTRYRVDRKIKRDKKTGNPHSSSAKIIKIEEKNEEVLEDKKSAVDKKCEEIIGLSIDDFTRTVVLPQGKFSEFLILKGKDRRDMLERLFSLEKYGDNLAFKLGKAISKERTSNLILIDKLKGYEGITEENKNIKQEEFKNLEEKEILINKELEQIKTIFEDSKELWNNQNELKELKTKEKALKERGEEFKNKERKIDLGEAFNNVNPYIEGFEKIIKDLKEIEEKRNFLEKSLEQIKIKKEEIYKNLEREKDRKENKLPILKLEEEKINDGIKIKNEIENLNREILKIEENLKNLKETEKGNIKLINENEVRVKNGREIIKKEEEKLESLNVDLDLREKICLGNDISNSIIRIEDEVNKINKKLGKYRKSLDENKNEKKNLEKDLEKKLEELKDKELLLENLKKPCEDFELIELEVKINNNEKLLKENSELEEKIKNSNKIILEVSERLKENRKEEINLKDNIKTLKENEKSFEIEVLAHKIRQELKEGELCPVCGSKHHDLDKLKNEVKFDFNEIKKDLEEKEKKLKELSNYINRDEIKLENENKNLEENQIKIKALGKDFKELPLEVLKQDLENLRKEKAFYEERKSDLEKEINKIKEESISLEGKTNTTKSLILNDEKSIKQESEELEEKSKELNINNKKLENLKEETNIEDFIKEKDILEKKDLEKDKIQGKLKSYKDKLEFLVEQKEQSEKNLHETEIKIATETKSLEEKKNFKDDKIKFLNEKVGNYSNLEVSLKQIKYEIQDIEKSFKLCNEEKSKIDLEFEKNNNEFIEEDSNLKGLKQRKIEEQEKLENSLRENYFSGIEEAKANKISKEELQTLKSSVEEYKSERLKIEGTIDNLTRKINGKELLEQEWFEIQEEQKNKEEEKNKLIEQKINLKNEINLIEKKLLEIKDLEEDKKKLEKKLGLLYDLEKLFKGKKFVEFVATNQLKYVSIEASKRLKDITNGNYGLEVDEDGKFIIRDYKNGGARRDATTLSGGETFLVSLSLALALSSQIQLKGTAPLELFFLDEGFGTLDENLLEVVMNSLEKIHHEKLKVGIISHVEAIKNRVPVKLILTPAEAGKGGSKVRIERN